MHHYKIHNREVALCRMFTHHECGTVFTDAVAERADSDFEELYARYLVMKRDPVSTLRHFNVSYILLSPEVPLSIPATAVGSTSEYSIYHL